MKHATVWFVVAAGLLCTGGVQAADDPRTAVRYFLGNWTCVTPIAATASTPARTVRTAWTFSSLYGDDAWIRVVYGDPARPDGSAVIGYVTDLKRFVYRDFHADGAYADISAAPPANNQWEWTGPYYPVTGGVLNGRIVYTMVDATRYHRSFEAIVDGKPTAMGGDTCTKVS
jgi:hypothetical protein